MARTKEETEGILLPSVQAIPEFASEDEEREWWATHDSSMLPGQDVQLRRVRSRDRMTRALSVSMDQQTLSRLKGLADERGVDYHEIAGQWLRERLSHETATR